MPKLDEFYRAHSMRAAEKHIASDAEFDIAIISEKLSSEEIDHLIDLIKKRQDSEGVAFVRLHHEGEVDSFEAAHDLMKGFDCYLTAPYSAEGMTEVCRIASEVRRKHLSKKLLFSCTHIAEMICEDFKIFVRLKRADDIRSKVPKRKIEKRMGKIALLEEEDKVVFFDALAEVFKKRGRPRSETQPQGYQGASERVKKRLEKKDGGTEVNEAKEQEQTAEAP